MLPACDVCGVEYVEGYEGPCQEYGAGLSDERFARAVERGLRPQQCPGTVSLVKTLLRQLAEARGKLDNLLESLGRIDYEGQTGDVEAFDDARAEATDFLDRLGGAV